MKAQNTTNEDQEEVQDDDRAPDQMEDEWPAFPSQTEDTDPLPVQVEQGPTDMIVMEEEDGIRVEEWIDSSIMDPNLHPSPLLSVRRITSRQDDGSQGHRTSGYRPIVSLRSIPRRRMDLPQEESGQATEEWPVYSQTNSPAGEEKSMPEDLCTSDDSDTTFEHEDSKESDEGSVQTDKDDDRAPDQIEDEQPAFFSQIEEDSGPTVQVEQGPPTEGPTIVIQTEEGDARATDQIEEEPALLSQTEVDTGTPAYGRAHNCNPE